MARSRQNVPEEAETPVSHHGDRAVDKARHSRLQLVGLEALDPQIHVDVTELKDKGAPNQWQFGQERTSRFLFIIFLIWPQVNGHLFLCHLCEM